VAPGGNESDPIKVGHLKGSTARSEIAGLVDVRGWRRVTFLLGALFVRSNPGPFKVKLASVGVCTRGPQLN